MHVCGPMIVIHSLSTVIFVVTDSDIFPSVALHVYVPASEALSGLNVSAIAILPGIPIWLFIGSSQIMVGVSVDPVTITEHTRL